MTDEKLTEIEVLEKLKQAVSNYIAETVEYSAYLEKNIEPLLTPGGINKYEALKHFNLGYKNAMENIQALLELMEIKK